MYAELEEKELQLQKKYNELNQQVQQLKKKQTGDAKEWKDRLKAKDSEMEVLKEMLRSSKVQLKSKETDIQRLNIKIKRLEKTNEIRENMINDIANNVKQGRNGDNGAALRLLNNTGANAASASGPTRNTSKDIHSEQIQAKKASGQLI